MAYKGMYILRQPEKMDVRAALPEKPIGFLDQLRVFIRSKGLAYTTEKTYVLWVRNFISFSKYQSPKDIKLADVEVYLNHLAQQRFCSPNTQATVLNALVFYSENSLRRARFICPHCQHSMVITNITRPQPQPG